MGIAIAAMAGAAVGLPPAGALYANAAAHVEFSDPIEEYCEWTAGASAHANADESDLLWHLKAEAAVNGGTPSNLGPMWWEVEERDWAKDTDKDAYVFSGLMSGEFRVGYVIEAWGEATATAFNQAPRESPPAHQVDTCEATAQGLVAGLLCDLEIDCSDDEP